MFVRGYSGFVLCAVIYGSEEKNRSGHLRVFLSAYEWQRGVESGPSSICSAIIRVLSDLMGRKTEH